jgi:hypothetical protein
VLVLCVQPGSLQQVVSSRVILSVSHKHDLQCQGRQQALC